VRQFRPAVASFSLELPSGHIDPKESPEQAVVRELREETGYETLEVIPLGPLASNTGRMSNRLWAFVAHVEPVGPGEPGIEVCVRPASDVANMVRDGQLSHALDLAVLMRAALGGHLRLID
jgi:ADP-ribose pyrophosphatase